MSEEGSNVLTAPACPSCWCFCHGSWSGHCGSRGRTQRGRVPHTVCSKKPPHPLRPVLGLRHGARENPNLVGSIIPQPPMPGHLYLFPQPSCRSGRGHSIRAAPRGAAGPPGVSSETLQDPPGPLPCLPTLTCLGAGTPVLLGSLFLTITWAVMWPQPPLSPMQTHEPLLPAPELPWTHLTLGILSPPGPSPFPASEADTTCPGATANTSWSCSPPQKRLLSSAMDPSLLTLTPA